MKLNIAEIELSVFKRQCLSRRILDLQMLASETGAWAEARNAAAKRVDWRFTTQDARSCIQIASLALHKSRLPFTYPKIGKTYGTSTFW